MPPLHTRNTAAKRTWFHLAGLALTAMSVAAGCSSSEEDDKKKILMPPEVGTNVNAWQQHQIAKANASYFMIYRHEWLAGEDVATLNEFGFNHARRIADRAMSVDYPIMIEPEPGQPELDQRRVEHLVEFLSDRNVPLARRRVIVAIPHEAPRDAEDFPLAPRSSGSSGRGSGGGGASSSHTTGP